MRILVFLLLTSCVFADSKAEIELRARLAAAQAQLAAAARDKAAMQESLEKLNADALARSEAAAVSSKTAAATATQRNAAAARQRNDASVAADANAASAQSTADSNAAESKATSEKNATASAVETSAIKAQMADTRRDNERWRLIQLIVALAGFVGVFIPVLLALVKLAGDSGVRKGEHSAAVDKMALIEAEARYAVVVAGAGTTDGRKSNLVKFSGMKFTVEVPKEHRERLAAALGKLDQVNLDPSTLAGKAENTDGSVVEFEVLNDTTIGITVTANPNNLSLDAMRAKVVGRITELLSPAAK